MEDQAADRVHRLGQTRPVRVVRYVAGDSIEERLLALQVGACVLVIFFCWGGGTLVTGMVGMAGPAGVSVCVGGVENGCMHACGVVLFVAGSSVLLCWWWPSVCVAGEPHLLGVMGGWAGTGPEAWDSACTIVQS